VDVEGFVVEGWVVSATETASGGIIDRLLLLTATTCSIRMLRRLLLFFFSPSLGLPLVGHHALFHRLPNVSFNGFLALLASLFLRLFRRGRSIINFCELCHQSIERSLSETLVVFGELITAHNSVQLSHAVICWSSDILLRVTNTLNSILGSRSHLIMCKRVSNKHLVENRLLGRQVFAREDGFLSLFDFGRWRNIIGDVVQAHFDTELRMPGSSQESLFSTGSDFLDCISYFVS